MKTVTKTAIANVRQNKGRNILTGIAIVLTTMLIFVIIAVGYASISMRMETVNRIYPTWHAMFRNMSEDHVNEFALHGEIESLGVRCDFGQVIQEKANTTMLAMDDKMIRLNKMKLEQGNFPKKKGEIVVSKGALDALGIYAEIGDTITIPYQLKQSRGLGGEESGEFQISGFVETTEESIKNRLYFIMTSMEFMREQVPIEQREYRVAFRLADVEKMTTDKIEKKCKEIADNFGVTPGNIVENSEYLLANYTDPALLSGMLIIVSVVVLAGMITIYSIYYVSMIPKVQEYGRLKALGATKPQIRQIVFREGMIIAILAIPIGLLVSSMLSKTIVRLMMNYSAETSEFAKEMIQTLDSGSVPVLQPWIFVLTILTVLLTVGLSLLIPMHKAGRISPMEAMRYEGAYGTKKKNRIGYQNLNLIRLTKANLTRNKKRTMITIITLGTTGVLFMIIATILTCAHPKEIAKEIIMKDYQMGLYTWSGDPLHPERAWGEVQKDNPLNEAFLERVKAVKGVESVKTTSIAEGELPDYHMDGEAWNTQIIGIDEQDKSVLEKEQIQGNISYAELKKGKKVIVNKTLLHWFPNIKIGDTIQILLTNGDEKVKRSFVVGAVGDYSEAFCKNAGLILPTSVLKGLQDYNITYYYDIEVEEQEKEGAYKALGKLVETSEFLQTESYENVLSKWNSYMKLTSVACYAFMMILGGVGIMNLINTMIHSIYSRKREIGIMQAIGLSEQQLIRMLQLEGMFYTIGTLIVSIGFGSIAGYFVFLWARLEGMFNIQNYHYPYIQASVLIVVVAVFQILLTYVISRNFRKQSLIERVRYAE